MNEQAHEIVYKRPPLYDKQRAAMFDPRRLSIIEASSKSGKTVSAIIWLYEQALQGKRGQNFWWVAPVTLQARIAFNRMRQHFLDQDGRSIFTVHLTDHTLTLINGTVIAFRGSDRPDTLYGEDVYACVVDEASRCFVAGTMVDTPSGPRAIETLGVGDMVLNAAGTGRIERVMRKRATAIAVTMVQGYSLASSVDHRYFTNRGWVEARNLGPEDIIITRDSAMSLMWGVVRAPAREAESEILFSPMSVSGGQSAVRAAAMRSVWGDVRCLRQETTDQAFLRAELLCEMADDATGDTGEDICTGCPQESEEITGSILGARYAADAQNEARLASAQRHAYSRNARESFRDAQAWWASAIASWWQWPRIDRSSARALAGVGFRLGVRACSASQAEAAWMADILASGHRAPSGKIGNRGRWQDPSRKKGAGTGSAEGCLLAGARVESVEVLERGNPRFANYSGGKDTVTLYDLAVSNHPSFSVYGFLVHNCREDAWHAIRSTLTATRGPIRIIGNVKGRKNWFYQLARLAEQGMPNFGYHKITAWDAVEAGVLEKEEIDSARSMLPEHIFKELYLAEPSDDEGNPFGAQHIRACYAPLSPRPAIAWGWDLARKVDWTVGIGLDEDGHVCEALRFQKPWGETVDIIKRFVGNTPALVDETGVGDPIVEAVKLPTRKGSNGAEVIEVSCPRLQGYRFTSASKQMLMEGLSLAIHERKIRFPEGPISVELLNFQYEFTRLGIRYEAAPGFHDDTVTALALAWRCFDDKELNYARNLDWIGVD